jgi:hypothetical protein
MELPHGPSTNNLNGFPPERMNLFRTWGMAQILILPSIPVRGEGLQPKLS